MADKQQSAMNLCRTIKKPSLTDVVHPELEQLANQDHDSDSWRLFHNIVTTVYTAI